MTEVTINSLSKLMDQDRVVALATFCPEPCCRSVCTASLPGDGGRDESVLRGKLLDLNLYWDEN